MTDELVRGRDRERGELDIAIGPGTDGFRVVLVTGDAGIGKSTLLREATARAAERGFRIAVASGRTAAVAAPFSPWAEALPELTEAVDPTAFGGALRDLAEICVDTNLAITATAATQPLLLAFDDAHALDEGSLALVAPVAEAAAVAGLHMTLLLIEQRDAVQVGHSYAPLLENLSGGHVVQRVDIGLLSDEVITTLVRELVDGDADEPSEFIAQIALRAQGNPWFARELASAYASGNREVPASIAAVATNRLAMLDQELRDATLAIALCPDGADTRWVHYLLGASVDHADALQSMIGSGLLHVDAHDRLAIAHPMMQRALREELSSAMRRALHSELAEAIGEDCITGAGGLRAQGYHLAEAGRTDEATALFIRAAAMNQELGRVHEAVADYSMAIDIEPRIANRADTLKRCAYLASQVASPRASEYWHELGRISAARGDHETYAYALYNQYWTSSDGNAVERLERAAMLGSDRYGWSARAEACLRSMRLDHEGAVQHDARALELARQHGDRMLEAFALDKMGLALSFVGRFEESVEALEHAVDIARQEHLHGLVLSGASNLADILAENLQTERSLASIRKAVEYVDERGLDSSKAWVYAMHALALARYGLLTEAKHVLSQAAKHEHRIPGEQFSALYYGVRAEVMFEIGELSDVHPALKAAAEVIEPTGIPSYVFEVDFMRARHAALERRFDEAFTISARLDVDEPASMGRLLLWTARLAVWTGNLGALKATHAHACRIERLSLLATHALDEIDLLAHAAMTGQVDALQLHADRWLVDSGRPLDAARCRAAAAFILERNGHADHAIDILKQVRQQLRDCGAVGDVGFVDGALRGMGSHTRAAYEATTVGTLTKRELEVARLVGSGLRNAQVADQLQLSQKTVAAHLSNIYGKVEVSSRGRLAAWMQVNDLVSAG